MVCCSKYYCHICDTTTLGTHYDHRRNEDHKVAKLINYMPNLSLFYVDYKADQFFVGIDVRVNCQIKNELQACTINSANSNYTVSPKNCHTLSLSPNISRFSKFFYCQTLSIVCNKVVINYFLSYVATLPCEI